MTLQVAESNAKPVARKVLFVDDDVNILASFRRRLGRRFDIVTVSGGAQGLELLDNDGPVAVVISDQRMPGMDGIEFLGEVKKRTPDTVRIMLTGNTDLNTAVNAVNEGSIFRFCTKPCPPDDLADAIEAGLKQYDLITAERDLLERTLAGSVKVLVDVLSLVDPVAFRKTRVMRGWARKVARRMNLANAWELDIATMLSPIGLITIPSEITTKVRAGDKLAKVDQEIYDRAPEIGKNLVSNIPRMKNLSEMIHYQNKGFDGSGFPGDWMAGTDIPQGARILKILIDLAAITESPDAAAFKTLETRHSLYDPEILGVVRSLFLDGNEAIAEPSEQNVVKVPVAELKPGCRLVSNIETVDGKLVLVAGSDVSLPQLELLRNMQKGGRLKEPIYIEGS